MIYFHQTDDPAAFAMQFHDRKDLPVRAMAEQIGCRQKAVKKLPTLSQHNLLYTPLALEQSSGERTAAYKASFMSGKRMIDLSGGLGVDTMFLARVFGQVVYCERDQKEKRKQNSRRPEHVAKEARHFPARVVRDGSHHEVRCVPDIRHSPKENSPHADRTQQVFRHIHMRSAQAEALSQCRERQVGRCVIEKRRKTAGCPEELPG